MIELNEVSKVYHRGKANQVTAIGSLSLHIHEQEFAVVVGANGSGKSTLLNMIAGSILPTSGTININNKVVSRLPEYKRSAWVARVFQNPLSGTAPDLSILDNFRLAALRTRSKGLHIGTTAEFKASVQEKISRLGMGLENKTQQLMGSLSGGQRQALTLLMSVMDDCKILLLDEPTAALDPRSAALVMQTAEQLISDYKLTAILITHQLKDAYQYGNRLIQMEEGRIIRDYDQQKKLNLAQHDLFDWFST